MEELFSLIVSEKTPRLSIGSLLRRQGFSRTLLRKLKRAEAIYKNGEKARLVELITPGDKIFVAKIPTPSSIISQEGELELIYEDKHFLVVNKPAGILSHPLSREPEGTLLNYLAGYLHGQVPHLIGRLDRGTSGLVIAAKDPLTASKLFKQRAEGLWLPKYLAFVRGKMQGEGEINLPLGHLCGRRWVSPDGKPSLTKYKVLAQSKEGSLLEVRLVTGRTNQIRIHFAALGHPLIGEDLYAKADSFPRPALHAWQVKLPNLDRVLTASPPQELKRLQATLFAKD